MSNAVIAGLTDLKPSNSDTMRSSAMASRSSCDRHRNRPPDAVPDARERWQACLRQARAFARHRFSLGPSAAMTAAAARVMPHAWNDGAQVALLRRQLEAMEDGGTGGDLVAGQSGALSAGPYERASLIAYYLKTKKPRSKLIVLDAKDSFTMQRLFQAAWKKLYPGLIEWVGLSNGGDRHVGRCRDRTLVTDFDKYQAAVANVIPPQQAGHVAELAGVADRTGWCPVDPVTFAPSCSRTSTSSATRPSLAPCRARLRRAFAGARSAPRRSSAARRRAARAADAHQPLLQPDRARLRHLAARHLSAGRRPVRRGRRRRHRQRAGCAARRRARPKPSRPTPGSRPSPARCSDEARGRHCRSQRPRPAAPGPVRRSRCAPTGSSAMPFRSR